MAKMHSRKKGKSRSKKIKRERKPEWLELNEKEIAKLVVDMTNQGMNSSRIGMVLRDSYGVPNLKSVIGKTITEVLKENNLEPGMPEDILNLIKKSVSLQEHMKKNAKDMSAKRGYQLTVSKIRRLGKYYVKKGKMPKDWHYDEEQAKLLVR